MTELMRQEMQEIFYLFFGGMGIMLLFLVRDFLCIRCRSFPRLRRSVYLAFWIFGAFFFYQFAYRGAYGVVSWYSLLAFGLGIILWKRVFCDIITLYNTVQKQNGEK
jgi:hypothetical protein